MRKTVLLGAIVCTMAAVPLSGQKPTTDPDWICAVRIYDSYSVDVDGRTVPPDPSLGVYPTVIRSDAKGWYTNGLEGVNCRIPQSQNSGLYGWLQVGFSRKVTRALWYSGQSAVDGGHQYGSFATGPAATFEVVRIASVSATELRPFRASVDHTQFLDRRAAFRGDADAWLNWGATGTNSVAVERLDACSWRVSLKRDDLLQLDEGSGFAHFRGQYRVPLLADVKILSGNGCG